ncbi:hypothetical protein LTR10_011573 [Elasticomyces elasticus]|uniref:RNA polymerase I-specific transcription initiation factor RRN6-like protein n=1 Tax=Exophiala sideris TaxID=1016849 RepID=A0ABR0JCV5_9EURO|nr:hypothetical protein LTR10_011573 [Elasticomyces elasticus]KAK5031970.1 hypothetical protein LTS07_004591 [Exophiala sideris]KAK5040899.1 hypothetical protein LTR13_003200 [Exophiala sideris]KAK5061767.1 hypothetical protein LTR69_004950 [Exophiala sideris]KAK5184467.1 hypothetical protein LTR44_003141 [Eurotiomycetes sp. CCFEE 6388]
MADTERARRTKYAHETNSLNYGHYGTAMYESKKRSWSFLRQPDGRRHSDQVTSSGFQLIHERVTPLPKEPDAYAQPASFGPAARKALLKKVPDAAFLPRHLLTVSNTSELEVSESAGEINARSGNRLTVGSVKLPFPGQSRKDAPIHGFAAFSTGQNGESLQLVDMGAETISWRNDEGFRETCRVPCPSSRTSLSWSNSIEKIKYVAGAGLNRQRFLIVKPSGTSILDPIIADDRSDNSRSFMKPSLLVTIPLSRTGKSPHAHAAFNPQDRTLVAIVDLQGQWSTWKIQGRRSRSAHVLSTAVLQSFNDLMSFSALRYHQETLDGWHRICWITDTRGLSRRLLVCGRRFAAVFDGLGDYEGQVDMRLGPLSDGNQILDVKQSTVMRTLTFVLTTSRILIFTSIEGPGPGLSQAEPLTLVCSWKHFRGDPNLKMARMDTASDTVSDTWVLLYSHSSHLAEMYHFRHELPDSRTLSKKDPSILELPTKIQETTQLIEDIVLHPVEFVVKGDPSIRADYGLMKMIISMGDGSIIEATYKHSLDGQNDANHVPKLRLPPEATGRSLQSSRYIEVNEMEDFIVPDGVGEDRIPALPVATSINDNDEQVSHMHMRNWQRLLDFDSFRLKEGSNSPINISIERALEQFESLQGSNNPQPMNVMSQLVDGSSILDVEDESEHVTAWLKSLKGRQNPSTEIVYAGLDTISLTSQESLLAYYDQLCHDYVGTLGDKVKDRNRVNRERLVRQVAGDVFLGNMIVRSNKVAPDPTSSDPTAVASLNLDLPSSPPERQPDSSEVSSTQPSASQSPAAEEEASLSRLRGYCSFRDRVIPDLTSHQPAISNILAHLPSSIKEDPAGYSYSSTNQKLKLAEEEVAALSLDPQERRKAMRQAARLQRKLEKTAQRSQEVMMQRQVLPGVASLRIGPGLPVRQIQSSQVAALESSQAPNSSQIAIPGLTMTQPERGAFGMRPLKAKGQSKGMKKRAGF